MPASVSETEAMVNICLGYLPQDKLAELFVRLNEEVGKHTDNDSLRVTLQMLNDAVVGKLS